MRQKDLADVVILFEEIIVEDLYQQLLRAAAKVVSVDEEFKVLCGVV